MKKTVFSIIIALGFNAFASAAQSPLRGSVSGQAAQPTFRMAQINQWNNMLPYALGAGALGLASAAGVSYRYYKKYNSKFEEQDRELTRLDRGLKPQSEKLGELNSVAQALDEMDTKVKYFAGHHTDSACHQRLWQLYNQLDHSDKSRVQSDLVEINTAVLGQNKTKFDNAIDALKAKIELMQGVNKQRITELTEEMKQPKKDKKTAEDEIAVLNRNKAIAKWVGISTGITAAGLTGFGIYKWFWPTTSKK